MQNIPNNALLRLPQVLALIPVSRSAWWAGCKSGRYPKPIKLGPRTTAWRAGRGSLRRGLCQRKSAVQKYKGNNTKKRFSPPAVFPHTDMRRVQYMQARIDVCSAESSRYIRRSLTPGVQMSAPSCALCRPCLASDTDYMAWAWRSGIRRIPSPHVPDVYLEPSVYPPATRRIQLRSTADTHPLHSRCPHHASPFLRGCLFIRPALSPKASLRFVYTLRV